MSAAAFSSAPSRQAPGGDEQPAAGAPAVLSSDTRLAEQEAALRASEERYRTLFTNMTEGFALGEALCDESGAPCDFRFLEVNEAFERQSGLRRADVEGRPMRQVLPQLEQGWIDVYCGVALTGRPVRFESYNRDLDRHFSVYCYSPAPGRFAIVFTDVTARQHAQEALRRSEEKYRALFEHAALGMARVSFADARWTDVNDAFCRMLGYSREEMLRTPWPEITHPEDVHLDLEPFRRMAAGELDAYTVEKRFVHRQGHHVWARLTLSLVRDGDGRPDYEIAAIENISARKQTEAALQQANEQLREADRRKNEFLAVLSHELRNPLAPIHNGLHILERAVPGGPQARRAQEVIARQARHLHRLVDDLLEVSRITQGRVRLSREILDLNALVRRSVEDHRSLFEAAGITFEAEIADAPLHVSADPTRIAQVVGNLLSNALKFTARGGRVVLAVSSREGGAWIRVRDDGIGIAPQLLPRLFEPFVQGESTLERSRGGLGLGLAVLRGLVELHGGSVVARSAGPGKGAEFTVALPTAAVDCERRSRERVRAGDGSARRIVVIEDNPDAAESLKSALELHGHSVVVARDGPEGVAAARSTRPDLVLCDIGLPGMDGFEVARTLRADPALARTRLVALSGYALPEDVEKARDSGFDGHLAKPVDPAALV